MSFPYGVFMVLKEVCFVSHRQKPSWCFVVRQMYFMPAASTRSSHASGSNFTGFHCFASFTYSARGTRARHCSCSWNP